MRVVALKNRRAEHGAVKTLLDAGLLATEIVPYIEIIKDSKANDVEAWNNLLAGRPFFVDYLRCDVKRYRGHEPEKAPLVYRLNNDLSYYRSRLLELSAYPNVIPVVAVREGVDRLDAKQLTALLKELKAKCSGRPVALRIEDYEGYEQALIDGLTPNDYLFYDISEQRFASKVMEHEELNSLGISAHRGILCSPRHRDVNNSNFENAQPTSLIDCSASVNYPRYGYEFYADYAGLRDNLPTRGGGGRGCALAVLYDANINRYRTYVCDDVNLGLGGYEAVVDEILSDEDILDPGRDCVALSTIREMKRTGKYGNWESWIKITLMRTLQQLGKNYS